MDSNVLEKELFFFKNYKFEYPYFSSFIGKELSNNANEAKFFSGPDRIFVLYQNNFYMLSNYEIFQQGKVFYEIAKQQILLKTLNIYYPKESQFIILYGENESNPKQKCIIVYDFEHHLIMHTLFLPIKYSNQKLLFLRGNTKSDHTISCISLVFEDAGIFIFHYPFTESYQHYNVENPEKYSTDILLLEFGKILVEEDGQKEIKDSLYLVTKETKKENDSENAKIVLSANLVDDLKFKDTLKQTKITLSKNGKEDDFPAVTLLNSNIICIQTKNKLFVKRYKIAKTQKKLELQERSELSIPINNVKSINGFSHYILISYEDSFSIYDYKFVSDLDAVNYNEINKKFQESSKENLQFFLSNECGTSSNDEPPASAFANKKNRELKCIYQLQGDSTFILYHMSRLFFVSKESLFVLMEESPSTIINNLVSSSKYFEYAKKQAKLHSMCASEIVDIEWKQANFIFTNEKYDEVTRSERAMDHFINTIGYKPSSQVIQLYMERREETLIRYLWGSEATPSEKSVIMNTKTGRIEHQKLLITLCVKLYSYSKTKLTEKELSESLPMQILNYLKQLPPDSKIHLNEDCKNALTDAFLSIGLIPEAIELAKTTKNYEKAFKLLFDTNKKNEIVKVLLENEDMSIEDKMKYLSEYGREILYINDEETTDLFIDNLAKLAVTILNEEKYVQIICLLFVPQNAAFSKSITLIEGQLQFNRDETRMSALFVKLFLKMKSDTKGLLELPAIFNDVLIQHLIILCRYERKDNYKNFKYENFNILTNALIGNNYNVDAAFLTIIDLPEEEYKFELLKQICLSHEKYAFHLIHFIAVNSKPSIIDESFSEAISELCDKWGKKNPDFYIDTILEFIKQGRCLEAIPSLLEKSTKVVPLPDMMNFILNMPKENLANLNIKLIKSYLVNWMDAMIKYEAELEKEISEYPKELHEIRNKDYSLNEMKAVRDEYCKMVENATTDISPPVIPCEKKRPLSTVPFNIFSSLSKKNACLSNSVDEYKNGATLPEFLLNELGSGILIDGLNPNIKPESAKEADNVKFPGEYDKNKFTPEADIMIKEFDEIFKKLNQ